MAYKALLYSRENGIATITINRPEALNALNDLVFNELYGLIHEIDHDSEVRVVIITGYGDKAFAAGVDITEMQPLDIVAAREFSTHLRRTFDSVCNLSRPVIAAVNGYALGGGCELAMCADMRIASTNAKFGQAEINLGIIPGAGGTQRLPRLIGMTRAKEMVFTGTPIDANAALAIGLVNKVVPSAFLMAEARELAGRILSKSAVTLSLAKTAMNSGANVDLHTGLDIEEQCFNECFATEDQKEGMKAFLEKRKPQFKNR
jgi:enoyl-CoA hydratase